MAQQVQVVAADFLKVEEIIDTRFGTEFSSDGVRQYTRQWLVVTARKEIGANSIWLAPGLPAPWSIYIGPDGLEFDELSVLVRRSARRKESDQFYHWIATAEYSTEVPEGGIPELTLHTTKADGSQNKPWTERPKVEWDWEELTHFPGRDLDGKIYANSARMPFAPAPGFPAARSVLVVTRNEPGFSREVASKYAYAVNSDIFLGAAPGTVQCLPPRAVPMNRGPLQYYRVTYRLRFNLPKRHDPTNEFNPFADRRAAEGEKLDLQTFQPELLDQGTHQLQNIPGVPWFEQQVPIYRGGPTPVSRDVLLDGNGRAAKANAKGNVVPTFLKFREFHSAPFRPIVEKGIFGRILGGL